MLLIPWIIDLTLSMKTLFSSLLLGYKNQNISH